MVLSASLSCRHLAAVEAKVDAISEAVSDLRAQSTGAAAASAGRLVSLEAALREVARGLQMVRDKQELADTQAELSRLAVKVRGWVCTRLGVLVGRLDITPLSCSCTPRIGCVKMRPDTTLFERIQPVYKCFRSPG